MKNVEALQMEQLPIDSLVPDARNPRQISVAEMESLTRSIQKFGFVQPIIVRRADMSVIGGHQRLVAARRLGMKTVPVVLLDISVEQARLLGLALNKISGTWDEELLARLLADLQAMPDVDISLSGFADAEIKDVLRSLETREKRERPETFDFADAMEQAKREPRTRPGDLWQLGDHRLLCGDATEVASVARLLGGAKASMCFTDPPYGVSYGDHGGAARTGPKRRIANDALPRDQWLAFVDRWSQNLLASVDGAIYVCMSSREWPAVCAGLEHAGGHWSDTIIWAKDTFTLGRADYQRQYEPIWFGWRDGTKHVWNGGRDQGDVWRVRKPDENPLHPTMKPLELMEGAINNSSNPGDTVLDLFLGSGSTLIACERAGRVCQGMELDPHYSDVVVARFEAFSGEKARKVTQ